MTMTFVQTFAAGGLNASLKKVAGVIAPLALLGACAMPPEGTGANDVANYIAAVESLGCDVGNEGDLQALEIQTGLTPTQLAEMAEYLVDSRQGAMLSNGGFRLKTGACAPEDEAATTTEATAAS